MRKLAIALAATIAMSTAAEANNWNNRRHHPRPHHHHNHNNWVAPLVGGLVIGGLLMSSQQNYYAGPGYGNVPAYGGYGYRYQPVCQRVFVGSFWDGWRWVRQYDTICQ